MAAFSSLPSDSTPASPSPGAAIAPMVRSELEDLRIQPPASPRAPLTSPPNLPAEIKSWVLDKPDSGPGYHVVAVVFPDTETCRTQGNLKSAQWRGRE